MTDEYCPYCSWPLRASGRCSGCRRYMKERSPKMNITRRTTITINNELMIAHDDEEKTFRVITPLGKDWHEADVIRLVQRYRAQALREAKALAEFLKVAAEKWPSAVEPAKDVEAERFAIAMQVLMEEAEQINTQPTEEEKK